MSKIKGIEVTDLKVGTGAEATQESCVAVNIRMFLRRGEEVHFSPALGPRMVINLARRDSIAGLLKGIPGMRLGGLRQIVISPHLAYGEAGIPGRVPPNALLRCEVELVALREHSAILPEDYQPGKLMCITKPNQNNHGVPQWTFMMHENGSSTLTFPLPGSTPVRWHQTMIVLDPRTADSLIQQALEEPRRLPDECIQWDSGRLEIPRRGGLPVRDKVTQSPCIVVSVTDLNERIMDYAVPDTGQNFLQSPLFKLVSDLITPHLISNAESAPQS
jgi:hypothetical protein